MTRDEAITRLSELLDLSRDDVARSAIDVLEIGVFGAEQIRGGRSYLVGFDGGHLFGASAMPLDELIKAYEAGRRSP